MAAAATSLIIGLPLPAAARSVSCETKRRIHPPPLTATITVENIPATLSCRPQKRNFHIVSCLPPSPPSNNRRFNPSTKLFVTGLSFRTTEESLRNAFKAFGQLLEVNLVMDKIANRPKGFAFVRYATEEESSKALEGMHGKLLSGSEGSTKADNLQKRFQFLDGRVIFVEFAKPRSEVRKGLKQKPELT